MRDIALFVRGRPRTEELLFFPPSFLVVRAWCVYCVLVVVQWLAVPVGCDVVWDAWLAGCLGGRVDGGRPKGRCPRTLRQREEIP